jgi:hypothetical protein
MAKRDSMSRARRSRNRRQDPISEPGTPAVPHGPDNAPTEAVPRCSPPELSEMVNEERTRLMKAQAVLGCVAFALLYEDWLEPPHRPSFVDAIAAAHDLVSNTLDRLGAC